MTLLETTAIVLDDQRLVLQLPKGISPGEHRVRLEIDPLVEEGPEASDVTPMKWDGDVLVYAGRSQVQPDLTQIIHDARDARIRELAGGLIP